MKRILSIMVYVLFGIIIAETNDVRLMVNNGHNGAVNYLEYRKEKNLLFSAGDDGTVKVWSLLNRHLIYNVRVSHLAVEEIAIHPVFSQFAALETDGLTTFRLSVWDWEENKRLFHLDFDEKPLFFTYSSRGSYLICGQFAWQSLSFYGSKYGRRISKMKEGFGIVTFVTDSRDEKKLLTYQPNGTITYWKISSGEVETKVKTLPDLTAMSISVDKRFMTASSGDKFVLVDLLSGAVRAEILQPGIIATSISPRGDEFACIYQQGAERKLARFYYLASRSAMYPIEVPDLGDVQHISFSEEYLLLSHEDGTIKKLSVTGEFTAFPSNTTAEISDFALVDNRMIIATSSRVFIFHSDYLAKDPSSSSTSSSSYLYVRTLENPLGVPVGIDFYDGEKLILWSKNKDVGSFVILDTITGEVVSQYTEFTSSLVQLTVHKNSIFTLDGMGICTIMNREDFEIEFQYPSAGINKFIFVGGENLVGGKSSFTEYGTTLQWINSKTKETVSIPDTRFVVYELVYDPRLDIFYSLGIELVGDDYYTVWKEHFGDGYERERMVLRYKGEDLAATLSINAKGNRIYTSLGFARVQRWDGRRISYFEKTSQIPRKLLLVGDNLFSLNRNSTITVWNVLTKRKVLDFYLFNNFEWLGLFADSQYIASRGADQSIEAFLGYRKTSHLKKLYRIQWQQVNHEMDYFELF